MSLAPPGLVVRVLPDVSGLDKEFDYAVPDELVDRIELGALVRVALGGRSVDGWITALDIDPVADRALSPIQRVLSVGPSADVLDLARWAAHRWAGRVGTLLKTASPPRRVARLPDAGVRSVEHRHGRTEAAASPAHPQADRADRADRGDRMVTVTRVPPAEDPSALVAGVAAAGGGATIVVVPRIGQARALAGSLRRRGLPARVHPSDWAAAAARGGIVIGARSAVWARVPELGAIIVLDEHDETLQEERNPTWHAREVAVERAARAGARCHLVSPAPSLAAVALVDGAVDGPGRGAERRGWPVIEVIDRRREDPARPTLFSPRVASIVRSPGTVLAILNRKGRAVMLACGRCGELVRTTDGEHLMTERDGRLVAPATGEERPVLCAACGSTALKRLRLGVTRAAEELAALAGEPVDELPAPATSPASQTRPVPRGRSVPRGRVAIGTEAALHLVSGVDTVVFLDFDAELLAPRYRAAEQAIGLLVLAARVTGGRQGGGRVILQTRSPEHRAVQAALRADPGLLVEAERALREPMGWPPYGALAELSGQAAPELAKAVAAAADVTILGPRPDGRYLVRAADPEALAAALAAAERPSGSVRVAVDPPRA